MKLSKLDPLVYAYTDLATKEEILQINSEINKDENWEIRFGEKDAQGNWITEDGSSFIETLDLSSKECFDIVYSGAVSALENFCLDRGIEFNVELITGIRTVDKHCPPTTLETHSDTLPPNCKEGYTVLIYLNDDYEGGELSFTVKDFEQKEVGPTSFGIKTKESPEAQSNIDKISFWIKPDPFTVLIFPPKSPYFHTAHEITGGHKLLIKGFYTVENFSV